VESPQSRNQIIAFNQAYGPADGGGIYVYQSDPVIESIAFYGNVAEAIGGDKTDPDYIGINGNLQTDPLFIDRMAGSRNLRLDLLSPLIDTADDTDTPPVDLDGAVRPQDGDADGVSRLDYGAYEQLSDIDGDGTTNAEDCLPESASLSALPDAIGNSLRLPGNGNGVIHWNRSRQSRSYHLYRGEFSSGQPWDADPACLQAGLLETETTDTELPADGFGFYYLVAAHNACGQSEAGRGSDGIAIFPSTPCTGTGADADGDGHPDDLDNCPLEFNPDQTDLDFDFIGSECDNCPALQNDVQQDWDGDSAGDACDPDDDNDGVPDEADCAPLDPVLQSSPGEIGRLDVRETAGTIEWTGLAAADSYDLGGGYLSDLRASRDTSAAECLVSGETYTRWVDTRDIPPPDDGYYYLARGRNACAPGSFGNSSNGSPRAENACP
jgi:hypothetical protein